ncbi:hypothetical protein [Gilvibacter sp.]|uniref:hypothetical protein n=1 Tax=Gilvibacter sp. TaxID=2729997 RepID=UPI003B51DAA8
MPDQKKSSYTSNFSPVQLRFLKRLALFLTPVVLIAIALELLVGTIPSTYSFVGQQLESESDKIEVAVFGSSQIKNSVNPEYIEKKTLNISSSAQHHNSDFQLLKGLVERLPALKTVVFEVSYGHFEIPHNTKYYWKKPVFLKYYGINTFERTVYPTDSLLYMSHPGFFTTQLFDKFVRDSMPAFNRFGFDTGNYDGRFKRLGFDLDTIMKDPINISRRESAVILKYNTAYFKEMLDFCHQRGLEVVIISPPTFTNYNNKRDAAVLRRRDSILALFQAQYPNLKLLIAETDSRYKVTDFRNGNHLNPDGAEKFSKQLDSLLNAN